MSNDVFDTPIPRDGWGRPLVHRDGTKKPVAYTRATTFVGCLEDTFNLSKWQQRMVAVGLADRPDLILSVAAHRDDKKEMDRITGEALDAAKAGAAATTGTALHALTERMDLGLPLGAIPQAYQADLDAYAQATRELSYVGIEQFRVVDDMKIGGTADRVLDMGDELMIADLKTGSIDYGIAKIAMQLAVYAHAVPYDHETKKRTPDPKPMNLTKALVIHLPAGTGTCTLHWVDIEAGWEGVHLAQQVRAWRARKGLSEKAAEYSGDTTFEAPTPADQVVDITTLDDLRKFYESAERNGLGSPELLQACIARKQELLGAA